MSNLLLFVALSLLDIVFVFIAARMGDKRLFGSIAINLILVSIFGAKLVSFFGYSTNISNIFYSCVFLATYFLLERQSKKEIYKTIVFGITCIIFFLGLSQGAVHFMSADVSSALDASMKIVFSLSLRIALASILAFAFAQYINICVYEWIKKKTGGRFLWVRTIGTTFIAQFVDSCLFFSIAFIDMPGNLLVRAILAGWIIKIVVIFMAIPFSYFDLYLLKRK